MQIKIAGNFSQVFTIQRDMIYVCNIRQWVEKRVDHYAFRPPGFICTTPGYMRFNPGI